MVAYLKAGSQDRTYSDYLRAAWEVEKEDSMELSQTLQTQTTNNAPKSWATSFFPLWKLQGNQPTHKAPTMQLAHLKEESARWDKDEWSDDPDGINGVTVEFMVHMVRGVKDTQTEEKCCYHCSSLVHFIHNCFLMKTLRENMQLNCKEGMALKKGAQSLLTKATTLNNL